MPGNRPIIERRIDQVKPRSEEIALSARAVSPGRIASWVVALLAIASSGCLDERRAGKLYTEAEERLDQGRIEEAVEIHARILETYPETDAARRVEREAPLYRSLSEATVRYPSRKARDVMVQTARAIESYRVDRRGRPDSLEALVPAYLSEFPVDSWSRPLVYRPAADGTGYELVCLGADGVPGGTGDDLDLLVANGEFVTAPQEDRP